MRRLLAILAFATAAAAATAAGSGVVVAPHIDPPGTPPVHMHALATYRLPIFVNFLLPRSQPHHGFTVEEPLFDLASTLVLALLALAVPRLPRPTLAPMCAMPSPAIGRAQWRALHVHGPPRIALLA